MDLSCRKYSSDTESRTVPVHQDAMQSLSGRDRIRYAPETVTPDTSARAHWVRLTAALCITALPVIVAGCSSGDPATTPKLAADSANSRSAPPHDLSIYPGLPDVPPLPGPTIACTYVDRGTDGPKTPPATASTSGTVNLTLDTTIGPVPLVLDRSHAPCTVNNFVSLAQQGFFNGTSCHRLSTDPGAQLYQCGDPTGTGTGGPGYTFADEYPVPSFRDAAQQNTLPPAILYSRGTIAMANTGVADSNGSQFFLLLGDSLLHPSYTAFGRIADAGLPVLDAAAAGGNDGSSPLGGGVPNTPVVIGAAR